MRQLILVSILLVFLVGCTDKLYIDDPVRPPAESPVIQELKEYYNSKFISKIVADFSFESDVGNIGIVKIWLTPLYHDYELERQKDILRDLGNPTNDICKVHGHNCGIYFLSQDDAIIAIHEPLGPKMFDPHLTV